MSTGGGNFHGLFVGINRYESVHVQNLASAVRDARAVHALFTDNLGGDTLLLADSEATSSRIREELRRLASASTPGDVVVVTFSGHGSDTHELVSYEADPFDISATTLPLEEFTDLIGAIPARHLLVVLDCCFSGGAGAKVLHSTMRARGRASGLPLSTEAFLEQMVGTGRVLLTASTAEQEAFEDIRLGHGYLTYYLVQALMGGGPGATTDTIHLLDLLHYVTAQVKAGVSGTFAARQEPTVRGQWDGEVIWPQFTRGPLYDALFPPTTPPPVTGDVQSLSGHRIPDEILDAWRSSIGELNELQQDAINTTGLFTSGNVVVTAPTSSGKTMIGELAALKATQAGGRSVFLLPTKALVNEQYERFSRVYGPCGVRVVRATGDYRDDVQALLHGQFDLGVFTYEKFSGLVLAHPHLLPMLSVVVVDEVQTIVDPDRGRDLELLLTLMKSRKDDGVEPQVIALSAVLGDLNGLDSWLEADLLQSDVRPVELHEGVMTQDGVYRYLDGDRQEQTAELMPAAYGDPRARTILVPLVAQLVSEDQQVIVVRGTRGEARGAAQYLANTLGLPAAERIREALPDGDPTRASTALRQCLRGGVAFHVSDLAAEDRRLVEEEFRRADSEIRVVVATTTLAQGVNLPAETVIMPELSRYLGPQRGTVWYTVADYKNIAGRAGRLGLRDKGRAITLAYDHSTYNRIWSGYINGVPEDIHSQLLDPSVDLYTVVLRMTALAAQRSASCTVAVDDVVDILANSFGAHQSRLSAAGDPFTSSNLTSIINELQQVGFLAALETGQTELTSLGLLVANSMLRVASAVRITDVLRRVHPDLTNLPTVLAVAQLTLELDQTRLPVNARGVGPELATFLGGLQGRGVASAALDAFSSYGSDRVVVAARAKKAMCALLWVNGVPISQIETFAMQHHKDRDASGPIAQVVARTRDVVDTVIDIATELHPSVALNGEFADLPLRLELGVPQSCVELARAGADLRREDFQRLVELGHLNAGPAALRDVDDQTLLDLLGGDRYRLRSLRLGLEANDASSDVPDLDDLLPSESKPPNADPRGT